MGKELYIKMPIEDKLAKMQSMTVRPIHQEAIDRDKAKKDNNLHTGAIEARIEEAKEKAKATPNLRKYAISLRSVCIELIMEYADDEVNGDLVTVEAESEEIAKDIILGDFGDLIFDLIYDVDARKKAKVELEKFLKEGES